MDSIFQYRAVGSDGKTIESSIEAKSQQDAVNALKMRDLSVIAIREAEAQSKDVSELGIFNAKPKATDIMIFCKQLSVMLDAGLPLDRALAILVEQTNNKILQRALSDVSTNIKQGIPFSKGMRLHPKIFPDLLVEMVESGELTGKLDEVLARMSVHYEKENRINSRIKGAMIYPAVLIVVAIVAVILLLTQIMPSFVIMFESADSALPTPTLIMISVSESLIKFWYVYVIVVLGAVFFIRSYGATENGKRNFDNLQLRLPIVGQSSKQIATSRFTRTLATLISSGVPIVKSLESAAKTTNNMVVIDSMHMVIDGIKRGVSLAALLKKVPIFPPMMVSMVGIGEETGDLDGLLAKTADFYDEELEAAMSRLLSLIEPLLIVIMAGAIGAVIIAMMLPMFDIFSTSMSAM